MKKFLFLLYILLFYCSSAQIVTGKRLPTQENLSNKSMMVGAFIDVNAASYPQSGYSIEQLIKDVLISGGSTCTANVTNVVVSPNLAATNTNRSWGYFNKGTTAFPFNDGVILMTGRAQSAGNNAIGATLSGSLGTGGDMDLASSLGVANSSLNDATYIEFDFIPTNNTITFNYIFASEEYTGGFPCNYSDGFALLLKKVGDPTYTNLAVLPGGAGPVSVTNIHPNIPGNCGAVNAQYFHGYNTPAIETNFNGRTVPLTASASVIPGQTYHFKMVLADYSDDTYDSGVFLQAGSFNIGVQLTNPAGVQLPPNLSICQGSSQVINASAPVAGTTFQWFLNGNAITGATSSSYTATQAGVYSVNVTVPGNSCPGTASITISTIPLPVAQNTSLTQCSSSNAATFNLISAQPNISTASGITFSYYQNLSDAQAANSNTITNPSAFSSGNATVYAVVNNGTCKNIANIQLIVTATPATPVITSTSNFLCPNGSVTLSSNYTTGNTWSTGATTQSITVNTAGTYTLTNANGSCVSSPGSITISDAPNPNVQITGNLTFCQGDSSVLTANTTGTGNTFLWSTGATSNTITVNTSGTYSVTVTTASGCQYTASAAVTAEQPPVAQNSSLVICSSLSTGTFDLTSAQPAISTTAGVSFTFYTNLADATAGNANSIATPSSYNSGNATIYVVVSKGTCKRIVQLQLNVSQTITPTITASSTVICGAGSVTLTSSSATGNTWSTGVTTQSITVNSAGTYSLVVTTGNCSSSPTSVTITSETNPNLQITGNLSFCAGGNTVLTATANGTGNSYLWSNGITTATNTISSAGTYSVTVTTVGGCTYTSSVTVTQNPVPTVQNATINSCSTTGTSVLDLTSVQPSISTSPGITFSYYNTLADANAGNPNFITTPTAYSTGTTIIYVRVSNGNCFKVAQIQITVGTTPVPVITQSAPAICAGTPVTLTSNYATGNSWSTGATTQSITVSTAGTYSLTVANGNCVSAAASVTLVSNPDPNVQITGTLAICQGTSTTLTATANGTGNTFSWSNGSSTAATAVNTPGVYTVTVTTPGGCQFSNSATVTLEPVINLIIAQPPQITCTNPTVTLNASASTFQAGSTIQWTATAGGTIVSGGNTLTPVVGSGGNYTLTVTNATGLHCSVQSTVTVIANNLPPVITLTAPKLKICEGESVILTAAGAQTYTWTGLSGSGSTQTVSPNTTTTYTVTGVGANGCAGNTTTITITVVPKITSALQDIHFCKGEKGTLDAGSGLNYTYLWNTGATTQTISVNTPGIYNVTINNGTCIKSFSATVSYTPVPVITEVVFLNNSLTIYVDLANTSNLEYSIDGGVSWQSSNIFTNVANNAHITIFAREKGVNCYGSAEYYTFYIPNVISPNADGMNDTIDFSSVANLKGFRANIYDRYGKQVFKATPKNTVWKGNYINSNVPTATYWYEVSWIDNISNKLIQKTGWILLKNRN